MGSATGAAELEKIMGKIKCSIYQAYNIHLIVCKQMNKTPKTLDQFRVLMWESESGKPRPIPA